MLVRHLSQLSWCWIQVLQHADLQSLKWEVARSKHMLWQNMCAEATQQHSSVTLETLVTAPAMVLTTEQSMNFIALSALA